MRTNAEYRHLADRLVDAAGFVIRGTIPEEELCRHVNPGCSEIADHARCEQALPDLWGALH